VRGGGNKLNFDLHRAFSLWTWLSLFILTFTVFSLNLYSEMFYGHEQDIESHARAI
jgi:hypothetical protein